MESVRSGRSAVSLPGEDPDITMVDVYFDKQNAETNAKVISTQPGDHIEVISIEKSSGGGFHEKGEKEKMQEAEEEEDNQSVSSRMLPEKYEWHMGKGDQFGTKEPIDLTKGANEEPGCGCNGDACIGKCCIVLGDVWGCPSGNKLTIGLKRIGTRFAMGLVFWAYFWSITIETPSRTALPAKHGHGGNLYGILMIFLFGIVAELCIINIPLPFDLPALPPLLASLIVGILLNNLPTIRVARQIDPAWNEVLREMSLGIILGEAGVEVDKVMMKKLGAVVPRLSFSPCLTEAVTWGIFGHLILHLPWIWSFTLGFVCGAVAPACVVPSMIKFQKRGLGVAHGVPTLLMAAASIDDIIAINGFNIIIGFVYPTGPIGKTIFLAFMNVIFGFIFGIVAGLLMWVFPDPRQHNVVRDRTFLLVFNSWFFIFMTTVINIPGAGTLGVLTSSFLGSSGWPEEQVEAVAHIYKSVWFVFQPLLFGLTGSNINMGLLTGTTVWQCLVTLLICLTIRLTVAGNAVSFLGWTHKEKFMTSISWIPKATVQAAIGGTALDKYHEVCDDYYTGVKSWPPLCNTTDSGTTVATNTNGSSWMATTVGYINNAITGSGMTTDDWMTTAVGNNNSTMTTQPSCVDGYSFSDFPTPGNCEHYKIYANQILQVSVLVIIFTAPLGVWFIGIAGPHLLTAPDDWDGKGDAEKGGQADDESSIDGSELSDMKEKKAGRDNSSFSMESEHSDPPGYESGNDTTHLQVSKM